MFRRAGLEIPHFVFRISASLCILERSARFCPIRRPVHLPARAVALLIRPLLFRTVLGRGALGHVYAHSRLYALGRVYALSRVHTLSLLRLFLI